MWNLDWNDLTQDEKQLLIRAAENTSCPCCGDSGQNALDVFGATVRVIRERDRKALKATMQAGDTTP